MFLQRNLAGLQSQAAIYRHITEEAPMSANAGKAGVPEGQGNSYFDRGRVETRFRATCAGRCLDVICGGKQVQTARAFSSGLTPRMLIIRFRL